MILTEFFRLSIEVFRSIGNKSFLGMCLEYTLLSEIVAGRKSCKVVNPFLGTVELRVAELSFAKTDPNKL